MRNQEPAMQYGRARRIAHRLCHGVETQLLRLNENQDLAGSAEYAESETAFLRLKTDWELLIVLLVRLRRSLRLISKSHEDFSNASNYLEKFDAQVPDLQTLRNFEEHFDDYSLGKGRGRRAKWGHLESYEIGAGMFKNGLGELTATNARKAAMIAWDAIQDLEQQAKNLGYLTWEERQALSSREEQNA